MPYRVEWYQGRVNRMTIGMPMAAGAIAAQEAAGLAAREIKSTYTGDLARDVGHATPVGMLRWLVGSSRPYALIEHFGGEIHNRGAPYMLLRDRRGGMARSSFGGAITAAIGSGPPERVSGVTGMPFVVHKGKHYLDYALVAFPRLFFAHMKSLGA